MVRVYLCVLFSWLGHSILLGAPFLPPDSLLTSRSVQSVRLQLGTTGPGVMYNRLLGPSGRLTLRVGGQYFAYRKPLRVGVGADSYLQIKPDLTIGIAQAGVLWRPFRRGSFFVAGGVGYTWHPTLQFTVIAENKLNFDGLELTPQDVGTVNLGFRWHPIVGYLGWGFGRSIPVKRLGVGVEMGVFYLGKPSVTLDYDGFLETTTIDEQVPKVERNLTSYRYLPTINLTLSYRLD